MRLPFSSTSISSAGSPRSDGERTKLDASEMEFCPTMKEGTVFDSVSSMLPVDWAVSSLPVSTSMGAEDSITVRSVRRVPVTMMSPRSLVASAPAGFSWAMAAPLAAISAAAAAIANGIRFIPDMVFLSLITTVAIQQLPRTQHGLFSKCYVLTQNGCARHIFIKIICEP